MQKKPPPVTGVILREEPFWTDDPVSKRELIAYAFNIFPLINKSQKIS